MWLLVMGSPAPLLADLDKPQAPKMVGIVFPVCRVEPFSFDASLTTLRIELAQEGVERVERMAPPAQDARATIEIVMECSAAVSELVIRVRDARTRGAERSMDLSDLPAALRPRGVALATAELARSVWSRPSAASFPAVSGPEAAASSPSTPPADLPPPEPPRAVMPPPRAPEQRPRTPPPSRAETRPAPHPERATPALPGFALGVTAGGRVYLADTTWLLGPRVSTRLHRWRLGVEGLGGLRGDPLGDVLLGVAAGFIGVDAWVHDTQNWRFRTGPRACGGMAFAQGTAQGGSTATRASELYFDLAAEAGAETRLSQQWSGVFELEAGWGRGLVARADQREIAALGGWLLGARLGVAWAP